jgi:hypothetical protein
MSKRELGLIKTELNMAQHLLDYLARSLQELDVSQRTAPAGEMTRGQGAALVLAELLELKTNPPL